MKAEIKSRFVAALRSGDYVQGEGSLHYVTDDGEDRFCALGVLCDLARQDGVTTEDRDYEVWAYGGSAFSLPEEVVHWAGVRDSLPAITAGDGTALRVVRNGQEFPAEVASVNDWGWTFDLIANAVEAGDLL